MSENPFLSINTDKSNRRQHRYPKFPRKRTMKIMLSDEALERLRQLSYKYTDPASIEDLLEQIGVYALHVSEPESDVDSESNITTEQCRESGYEDGLQGNPQLFLQMFGNTLTDKFQIAYMRGFFEGNYIRNTE